ncbi:Lsr2 family DNA-binding protein [Streptosporangium canum]|uniref:Lsr2 family DNA-binding protein n=1 Tax=Streptosporangium canum TaxID=324952 RepID=UPI0036AF9E07
MPDRDVSPLRVSHLLLTRELSRRIREWGKAQGLSVSERGRIAFQITDAFFVANPDALATADRIERVRATVREPGDGRATPDRADGAASVVSGNRQGGVD